MKLFKNCFLLIILIENIYLFGQSNYFQYNHDMRNVKKVLFQEEYDLAYVKFKEATANVDYVFAEDLRLFSAICLNLNKCDEVLAAYKKAVRQGFNYSDDYLDHFKEKCTSFNNEFESGLLSDYEHYKAQLNIEYLNTINTYFEMDQSMRRKYSNGEIGPLEFEKIDSTVISKVMPFIKKHGIADERMVGKEAQDKLFIILLHNDKDKSNKELGPYLLDALVNGKIKPENYAWLIDRRRVWGDKLEAFYYQIPNGFDKLSELEINDINRRRHAIGCRSLSDYEIIKEADGSIKMTEKN